MNLVEHMGLAGERMQWPEYGYGKDLAKLPLMENRLYIIFNHFNDII